MRILFSILVVLHILCFPTQSAFAAKKDKSAPIIETKAGLNIPEWGIAIDAHFDPRLTDLIPGYHIVNIVLTNRRNAPITLNPIRDKWTIVDSEGKKHTAQNEINKTIWKKLPAALQKKLAYPKSVNPGNLTTIDVFIDDAVNLANFKQIAWKSDFFDKEFNALTSYEESIHVGEVDDRQQPIPQAERPQPFTNNDYLKTRDEVLRANPALNKWQEQEVKSPAAPTDADDNVIILH